MDYLHAQQAAEKAEATESAEEQDEEEDDEEAMLEEEETVVDVEEFVPPIVYVSSAILMQRGRPSRKSKLSIFMSFIFLGIEYNNALKLFLF